MPLGLLVTGKLQLPLEEGQQPAPVDLCLNMSFTEKVNEDRAYAAAIANDPVSLGTMSSHGARLVLVKSPLGGCEVAFNGSAIRFPVPSGGYFLWGDSLGGFITAIAITTLGPARVMILAVA